MIPYQQDDKYADGGSPHAKQVFMTDYRRYLFKEEEVYAAGWLHQPSSPLRPATHSAVSIIAFRSQLRAMKMNAAHLQQWHSLSRGSVIVWLSGRTRQISDFAYIIGNGTLIK